MTTIIRLTATALLSVGFAAQSYAASGLEEGSLLANPFTLSLGTFFINTGTKIQVNGAAGNEQGSVIDLNRDLGFTNETRWRIDGLWRFTEHQSLRLEYFDYSQDKTRTLNRDLIIGDTTYPVNGSLSANVSTKIAELAYQYAIFKKQTWELDLSAGIHWIKFDFGVNGVGTYPNPEPPPATLTTQVSKNASLTSSGLPLPVFGINGMWEFAHNWYLGGIAEFFYISYDGYTGSITDARLGVQYMFNKHFGVGAGFERFATNLSVDRTAFNGDFNWHYSGAIVQITGAF